MNEPPRTASARRLLYGAGLNLETTQGKPPAGPHPVRAALQQVFMEAGAFVHNLTHRQGQRVPYGGVSPV